MGFLNFLLHEKSKISNFSLSFQIYVPYDLKNQACNNYKYRTDVKRTVSQERQQQEHVKSGIPVLHEHWIMYK